MAVVSGGAGIDAPVRSAAAQRPVRLNNPLGEPEHHGEHVLGHRVSVGASLVGDQDASLGAGVDVDLIDARPMDRDAAQLGQLVEQ